MAKIVKVRRSAVSGRFASKEDVKRHPSTTVTERRKMRKRKRTRSGQFKKG